MLSKEKAKFELLLPRLEVDETMTGFFVARQNPSIFRNLFFSWLPTSGIKTYLVGITDLGIHLHQLSLMGKSNNINFFYGMRLGIWALKRGYFKVI